MRHLAYVSGLALVACAAAPPAARPSGSAAAPPVTSVPPAAPTSATGRELAAIKAKLMSADYRADLAGLATLRDDAARFESDAELGYLAYYWAGFASWRIAMNGSNTDMKQPEMETQLERAAGDMYLAIRARGDFADAYAAAAGINGWILGVHAGETGNAITERASLTFMLLARAKALEPDNPRVLWIQGGFQLIAPPDRGGGSASAIETFRKMLTITERDGADPRSPAPDWGKPEALMMLAHAYLAATPPDLVAAREQARAALAIEPDWSYVRDHLLPKIDQTRP